MKNKKHRLTVIYSDGFYPRYDNLIYEATDEDLVGSGMGFGERDMEFEFNSLRELNHMKKKIKNVAPRVKFLVSLE